MVHLYRDVSVARANLPPNRVILTPPICTMGEDAHFTQYDVFATLGNGRHLMMATTRECRRCLPSPGWQTSSGTASCEW
jgi:hypothetical protein